MISASLAVDRHALGLGLAPHHHSHHHSHHPNAHTMTFGEPFLLGPTAPPVPHTATSSKPTLSPPEFLRPLPKLGPRYNTTNTNNTTTPVNGCRVVSHSLAPRVSTSTNKYHHDPVPGAVNLSKDDVVVVDDTNPHVQFQPPSSYRFPITQPPYYPGSYIYPTHYSSLMSRGTYLPQPQTQQQQPQPPPPPPPPPHVDTYRHHSPPAPSSPGQFLPPTPTFSPPQSPSVKPGQSVLLGKRFKVPSGKEGSLKHRILTRPASDVSSRKRATIHPPNFTKGSLIQLANGDLKKVEDMRTEDFISSAEKSEALRLDPSTVVRLAENHGTALLTLSYGEHRSQVDFETTIENPFFVFGQGWSSYSPERSYQLYGLKCHRLQVGDICISLTPRPTTNDPKKLATTTNAETALDTLPRKRRWSAPEHFSDEEVLPMKKN